MRAPYICVRCGVAVTWSVEWPSPNRTRRIAAQAVHAARATCGSSVARATRVAFAAEAIHTVRITSTAAAVYEVELPRRFGDR